MVKRILMPRLSLTMKTGSVISWFKKQGDLIKKGEPIVEVLSEKATYEIEAPESGVILKTFVDEGVEVPVGSSLAIIGQPGEKIPDLKEETKPARPEPSVVMEPSKKAVIGVTKERVIASPSAKRVAREHNIDLSEIKGSGSDGRIVESDVRRIIKDKEKLEPSVKEIIPLVGIRKTTAERVASSFQTAAHSYLTMEIDMTNAEKLKTRKKISHTVLLIHAVSKALRAKISINSALVNERIQVYEDINIGVAISTTKGLVVPIIHDADRKDLNEISVELKELIGKARHGSLIKEQLTGGTFTVTNLGMYEVDMFLPIINPPEAAILAVGRIAERPYVHDGEISVRPAMTTTLAYDHRIIDGAPAAEFLKEIKRNIENL